MVFACYRRFAESRRKQRGKAAADRDTASIRSNSSAGFKPRPGSAEEQAAVQVTSSV